MKKLLPALLLALMALCLSCQQVPITGREQLSLVPADELISASNDAYQQYVSSHKIIKGTPQAAAVQRVGTKVANAVENYFNQRGQADRLAGYHWQFNLVEDPTANAFSLPGGQAVVNTGILPITQDDAGLAAVMSHEIAHTIANHSEERVSQQMLAQLGTSVLSAAFSQQPSQAQSILSAALGMGTQLGVLLPYSRLQETEADHLGLIFMAMAGYNPQTAVNFWQRMEANAGSGAPPQFLSTHPTAENRIQQIQAFMPEAMSYYKG